MTEPKEDPDVMVCLACHTRITQKNFWTHKCKNKEAYGWIKESELTKKTVH